MLNQKRIEHLTNKIMKEFWENPNIAEIYSDNSLLKTKIHKIFNKYCNFDQKLDEEVKKKLKHLKPGSQEYEIEYNKIMDEMKRIRKLK